MAFPCSEVFPLQPFPVVKSLVTTSGPTCRRGKPGVVQGKDFGIEFTSSSTFGPLFTCRIQTVSVSVGSKIKRFKNPDLLYALLIEISMFHKF
ncbi:hypothetical protein CMV_022332 [Castanea mollissima]|uniref:Uncharacterized protein n=1 Tax=Castanea mollissima TaxID=60419 RepID=A0A8J4V855_9ROSI|nr:hypothetical protein CMV_022332 [Castanea mollissima]